MQSHNIHALQPRLHMQTQDLTINSNSNSDLNENRDHPTTELTSPCFSDSSASSFHFDNNRINPKFSDQSPFSKDISQIISLYASTSPLPPTVNLVETYLLKFLKRIVYKYFEMAHRHPDLHCIFILFKKEKQKITKLKEKLFPPTFVPKHIVASSQLRKKLESNIFFRNPCKFSKAEAEIIEVDNETEIDNSKADSPKKQKKRKFETCCPEISCNECCCSKIATNSLNLEDKMVIDENLSSCDSVEFLETETETSYSVCKCHNYQWALKKRRVQTEAPHFYSSTTIYGRSSAEEPVQFPNLETPASAKEKATPPREQVQSPREVSSPEDEKEKKHSYITQGPHHKDVNVVLNLEKAELINNLKEDLEINQFQRNFLHFNRDYKIDDDEQTRDQKQKFLKWLSVPKFFFTSSRSNELFAKNSEIFFEILLDFSVEMISFFCQVAAICKNENSNFEDNSKGVIESIYYEEAFKRITLQELAYSSPSAFANDSNLN